jgi:hypothetical protein
MRRFTKKQYLVAGAAAVIVAAGAGTALAYWSTTGSGTGSATTGTSSDLAVVIAAPTGDLLTPGGPTDTVSFTVTNPNTGHQNYSNALATVTSTSNAGCNASDFSISNLVPGYADLASNATATGSFDLQMINKTDTSQDACKGVTVNLKVAVS